MIMGWFLPHVFLAGILSAGLYMISAEPAQIENNLAHISPVKLPASPKWETLVSTSKMLIEVDSTTMSTQVKNRSWEVLSTLRIHFFKEINIEGTTKKGWFYISEISAACKDDKIHFNKSTVYTKEGVQLATASNLGAITNPNNPKSFVSIWLYMSCKDLIHKPVPMIA